MNEMSSEDAAKLEHLRKVAEKLPGIYDAINMCRAGRITKDEAFDQIAVIMLGPWSPRHP